MRALIVAEHDEKTIDRSTSRVVAAAAELGVEAIDVVVIAASTPALASQAAAIPAVNRVLALEAADNSPCLAAVWAPRLAAVAQHYTHVLAASTSFGKDLLPRVAALLGVGMLSDVIAIESAHRFRRPVYAGNAICRIAADPARQLCATVRPSAFAELTGDNSAPIETAAASVTAPTHTRHVERRPAAAAGPDLQSADRVVAGGRGLGSERDFALIEALAGALEAAVGASRAAVDSGWATNDKQVGQTGKIIAPALYIAVGISGAIQHLTGIRDAGTVVAINNDASAPLCETADLVLIADLFQAVPELIAKLGSR